MICLSLNADWLTIGLEQGREVHKYTSQYNFILFFWRYINQFKNSDIIDAGAFIVLILKVSSIVKDFKRNIKSVTRNLKMFLLLIHKFNKFSVFLRAD